MTWHHNNHKQMVGNKDFFPKLTNSYNTNRLHNSLILSGPKGVEKFHFAVYLAHFLLVDGQDLDVSNKLENASHPDFKILKCEEESDIISVDQVRGINDFLRFTTIESKNKVIIIDSLDSMNNNAANALLKILEEPPKNCYFICLAHSIGKILPTIRSRCRIENLYNISQEDFTQHFESFDGEVDTLYTISSGSIGIANSLIDNNFSDLVTLIRHIIGGNRDYHSVKKLAEYFASSKEKWNIAYKTLWLELHKKQKNDILNNKQYDPSKADKIENLMKFIYSAKRSHLDVQQTILGALS